MDAVDLIIASEAVKQVDNLISKLSIADQELLKISQSALIASKNIATISVPSQLVKNTQDLSAMNEALAKQDAIIKSLEEKIVKLSSARKKHSETTLQERVDSRLLLQQETQEAKALSELTGAYQKLDIAHKKALKSAQDAGAEFGRLSPQFKKAAAEANKLDKELKEIDKDLGKNQRNVGNYTKGFGMLSGALGAFGISTGIAGVAMLTKDIYDQIKSMEQLDLALETVTGSQKEFSEAQAFLSRLSESYGSNLKKLTESYIQFYASAKDKISGREIEDIFESISKSAGVLGLSTAKQEKAFLALNQMMSKGTIQAEELRGQLSEALPNAMGIMTKAVQALNPNMKVTEQTIAKMMKDGKLMSAEVLPEFARQMEIAYGIENINRVDTLAASTERMSLKWTEFLRIVQDGKLGEAIGQTFKGATIIASEFLDLLTKIVATQSQLNESEVSKGKEVGKELFQDEFDKNGGKTRGEQLDFINKAIETGIINVREYAQELKKVNRELSESMFPQFEYQLKARAKALSNQLGIESGFVTAAKDQRKELLKVTEQGATELTAAQLKAEEDRLKALAELRKKELQLQLAYIDQKLNDEDSYYTDRLHYLDLDYLKRIEIAKVNYDEELRLAKNSQTKQKTALINFQMENMKLLEDFNKKKEALERLDLNPITQLVKSKTKNPLDELADSGKRAQEELEKAGDKAERLRLKMEELRQKTKEWLGSFSSEFLQNSGFASLESYFDGTFKTLFENADSAQERFAVMFNSIAESAQEAFNFISQLSQDNFKSEYERLDKQTEVSKKYAGDNEAAQKKVDEDSEKRKKEIANREAKAKQKQAMFNIAIDTAQAIIGLWASPGFPAAIPLAAIVGALGIAQMAIVSSQKIPQYFKGGIHKQGGLALINDGGGSNYVETVRTPDGKTTQYKGRNVLLDLPKNSEILTHDQWQKEQLMPMINSKGISMQNKFVSRVSGNDFNYQIFDNIIGKHLGNIVTQNTIIDKGGIRIWSENQGNIKRENQRISSSKGLIF